MFKLLKCQRTKVFIKGHNCINTKCNQEESSHHWSSSLSQLNKLHVTHPCFSALRMHRSHVEGVLGHSDGTWAGLMSSQVILMLPINRPHFDVDGSNKKWAEPQEACQPHSRVNRSETELRIPPSFQAGAQIPLSSLPLVMKHLVMSWKGGQWSENNHDSRIEWACLEHWMAPAFDSDLAGHLRAP